MPGDDEQEEDDAEDGEDALRQLSTTQLTLSVTASATRQMPRTVKKMTDRRRPLIIQRG